jgi:hypothetical protein
VTHVLLALLAVLITVLAIGAAVGFFTRNVDDPERALGWARGAGVPVTAGNRALVQWYSTLSGTLRVVGTLSGWVLGTAFDRATNLDTSAGAGFWVWLIAGWVVGGSWAYRCVARSITLERPVASLVPRRTLDYVPRVVRWGPPIAASIVVAIAVLGIWAGVPADAAGWPVASTADLVALAAVAVTMAGTATYATQRVIARRQAIEDPAFVAVDDAMRATTAHLIGAGTTAAILLVAMSTANAVLGPRQLPFGIRGWLPLVLLVGVVVFGRYLPYRPWRVRRLHPRLRAQVAP